MLTTDRVNKNRRISDKICKFFQLFEIIVSSTVPNLHVIGVPQKVVFVTMAYSDSLP